MEEELWQEVEKLQKDIHDIAVRKGINSPEAIRASQDFRNKMDEYNRAIGKR